MDKRIKATWVKALRSGKYAQTTGRLRQDDNPEVPVSFCCLGVLCEVVTRVRQVNSGNKHSLNSDTQDLIGLTDEEEGLLIEANDEHHWTFEDIAAYIDAML